MRSAKGPTPRSRPCPIQADEDLVLYDVKAILRIAPDEVRKLDALKPPATISSEYVEMIRVLKRSVGLSDLLLTGALNGQQAAAATSRQVGRLNALGNQIAASLGLFACAANAIPRGANIPPSLFPLPGCYQFRAISFLT